MSRHHSIDYIEFTVTDLALSKQFYGAVFGWTFTDYGPAYSGIQRMSGEGESGGFEVGEVRPGGVLVILYSDALEVTLEAVKASGGKISKEVFEFPGGRRFHFVDPSGNELAVWTQSA